MVQDYGYKPEEAAESRYGFSELPAYFWNHLNLYRGWDQLWDLHEDLKAERYKPRRIRNQDEVEKLSRKFKKHPLYPLYQEHVTSRDGRKAYVALIEKCSG